MLWIENFLSLVFPNTCLVCGGHLLLSEKYFCFICYGEFPCTFLWKERKNVIARIFTGRLPVFFAASLFEFEQENGIQRILHALKYKKNADLGLEMGRIMGRFMLEIECLNDLDALIPVPLHRDKKKARGYNQSQLLAEGCAEELKIPVLENYLQRKVASESQTKKKRYDRWENVKDIFRIQDQANTTGLKHVLLVDDVITTGATLEGCGHVLRNSGIEKISVFTLARSG